MTTKQKSFFRVINKVHFRLRIQQILNYTAWGFLAGVFFVMFLPYLSGILLALSLVIWILLPPTWAFSARLIDKHYHFKDRILTAFILLRKTNQTPMQQLQISDAAEHLIRVKPQEVLPIRIPKTLWVAFGILVLEITAVGIVQHFAQPVNISETVVQTLPIDQAALQNEIIAKAEELALKFTEEESLTELTEHLQKLRDKLVNVKDKKESLLTLSEMEEALQTARNSLQLETMEMSMQELADTLELSEQTLPISRAIEKEDYSQAATDLKKFAADMMAKLSKPERETIAKEMQILADSAEKRNQNSLKESAEKLSEALKNEDSELAQSAAEELAEDIEKHGVRQGIAKALDSKQQTLGMMKADSGLGLSGGKNIAKSKTEGKNWGTGSAGNPNAGPETNIQSQREQQKLTGTLSEQGESQTETIDSQEMMTAQSQRDYQERYQEYRQLSEAVLDSEPIPLGQRQVIRRYFELIHPESE